MKYKCADCGKEFSIDGDVPSSCPYCRSEKIEECLDISPLPWRISIPEHGRAKNWKRTHIVANDGYLVCGPGSSVHSEANKRFIVKVVNEYYENHK